LKDIRAVHKGEKEIGGKETSKKPVQLPNRLQRASATKSMKGEQSTPRRAGPRT